MPTKISALEIAIFGLKMMVKSGLEFFLKLKFFDFSWMQKFINSKKNFLKPHEESLFEAQKKWAPMYNAILDANPP